MLLRPAEHANINQVMNGHRSLVARTVCFLLLGADLQRDLELFLRRLDIGPRYRPVVVQHDGLKHVRYHILQIQRCLLPQRSYETACIRIRPFGIAVLLQKIPQCQVYSILPDVVR